MNDHIIVCGMGQVGYRIVGLLCRLGERVTVITQPTRADWIREVEARHVQVIIGDARDRSLLAAAGLQTARAVIAATDQDPVNIEIALDVRQDRVEVPVVVRLFDDKLGPQLETTFGVRCVSVAALAAPSFAAAALGDQVVGSFRLDGVVHDIGQLPIDAHSSLVGKSLRDFSTSHQLTILAHAPSAPAVPDTRPPLLPSMDTPLRPGDAVTIVIPASGWDRLESQELAVRRPSAGPWSALVAKLRHSLLGPQGVLAMAENVSPLVRGLVTIAGFILAVSVGVFSFAMELSLVDSLYFAVSTITTTGLGDITPLGHSDGLKIYVVLLMMFGSVAPLVLYSIVTDFIVSARLEHVLGRKHVPAEDHVVVAGLGNVGYYVVDELHAHGAQVAAIDHDAGGDLVNAVREHTPVVVGDARLQETLAKAGVASARGVVVVTDNDVTSLGIALATRHLNPRARIAVRLFDTELARKVQQAIANDMVIMSGSTIAAPTFVAAALYPDLLHALELNGALVVLLHRRVDVRWAQLAPNELREQEGLTVLLRRILGQRAYLPETENQHLVDGEDVVVMASRSLDLDGGSRSTDPVRS